MNIDYVAEDYAAGCLVVPVVGDFSTPAKATAELERNRCDESRTQRYDAGPAAGHRAAVAPAATRSNRVHEQIRS